MLRALLLLGATAAAGALVWSASRVHSATTSGYWAELGLLAAAGLVLGIARPAGAGTAGRPRLATATAAIAVVPGLVVAAWIALAAQPNGSWLERHVAAWSRDIHAGAIVSDLGRLAPALALGLGVLVASSLPPAERRTTSPVLPAARAEEEATAVRRPSKSDDLTEDVRAV